MTRVLSDLLGAREPMFQQSLKQMEVMAGHPGADIRLSSEIQQTMRVKLKELQLDGSDTTGPELYGALKQRLHTDEKQLQNVLEHHASRAGDPCDYHTNLARLLESNVGSRQTFAMKSSAAKKILKANLPKKTMKALGYRSADSMLKHESPAALFAAAWLVESGLWAKKVVASYTKLSSNDFEQRELHIESPVSRRWQALGESVVAVQKHHVLSFKEHGAVIILPLPADKPDFSLLTTAVLTLHAVNEIRAAGTFLKLHQMQSDFGGILQEIVLGEPMLPVTSLDEPISWHSLHQYFNRLGNGHQIDLFEPLVAAEELVWSPIEAVLARIEPALGFWQGSSYLGFMSGGSPVSCNLTDALLSHANNLGFESRIAQYLKQSLRSELLLRYLSHDKLEQIVFDRLQLKLAPEMAID